MSVKSEDKYFESLNELLKKAYELKFEFIDEPHPDHNGDIAILPNINFQSLVTQALMLTRHYKFIESQEDRTIYYRLSGFRDIRIFGENQSFAMEDFIQLLDAIISQISSGIICFSLSNLPALGDGKLTEIGSCNLDYLSEEIRTNVRSDIYELRVAAETKMYKSAALLAGSIAEAVLLGVANLNKDLSANYIQSFKSNKSFPDKCGIEELGYICRQANILTDNKIDLSALIEYRDRIHPNKHTTSKRSLDDSDILLILGNLGKVLSNLTNSEKQGRIKAFKEKALGAL